MRILIAEDDPTCRLILKKHLEKLGHDVEQTVDGAQAWEVFQQTEPEVIISDWMMPKMNGVQLCQAVRKLDGRSYTYFVLLTALNDKSSVLKGLEAGADDYLTKPLDRAELQARLISARRVTDLHKELARLNEELYNEGRRDPLTRVANRRRMTEDLEEVVKSGRGFSVALCDVDFFKRYNDTAGHAAGDECLKSVAQCLVDNGRTTDAVYRYGGEEFVVVLPEQTIDGACAATERLRSAIEELAVPHPGKGPGVS